MKVLFMGTPDFAVPCLEKLIEEKYEITGVITQPDRPKGRGNTMMCSPVKEAALKAGITVHTPQKLNTPEGIALVESIKFDVIVVVAFGQLLPKAILDMPKYGCINVHSSLLPKYRGAAPIQWAVINGEEYSGVTTMLMDEGLDTGDILMVDKFKLDPKETGGSLFDKLAVVGANLLIKTLKAVEADELSRTKQNNEESTYVGMLKKSHGAIDFSKSAMEIERLIRGLTPWPSAFAKLEGKTIKLYDCDVVSKEEICALSNDTKVSEQIDQLCVNGVGTIVYVDKKNIYVSTGKDFLKINSLQSEGKKRMDCDAFLRGFQVSVAQQFHQ